mmetsp:Transcript_18928/g.31051  ORF Transcript_18928/g.31051 Transcript_18928/m.31051 type:complete len:385 (-) Transcript_18928:479-1633(-)|eukprot:CAMPEP_0184650172 /NCGR_PEP_ID=MMETSP0308-20130426/7697_1 /TAXON_ID=38269 /ORGANISM="Gloeochaete witrockiana, Strain SAG 46.84" /LENGTH=384 /DNA_ID=CAMNT_0027083521 /DNA_START=119 /DNA_END=1273 /DNA_ORIENTATION=+
MSQNGIPLLVAVLAAIVLTIGSSVDAFDIPNAGHSSGTAGSIELRHLQEFPSSVLLRVNEPAGWTEGVAVDQSANRLYVSGQAQFGIPLAPYMNVYKLDTGALIKHVSITVPPGLPFYAASCLALTKNSVFVVVQFVGIVKIDKVTFSQSVYAPPPPKVYTSIYPPPPVLDYLLNDLVFDANGNLYVTDSVQATIFRVKKGTNQMKAWFTDVRLDGIFIGANGLRISPLGDRIFVTVSVVPTANGNPVGKVYSLPLKEKPGAADLTTVYTYTNTFPDGIAFGLGKRLYVAASGTNQISVLAFNSGTFAGPAYEHKRISGPATIRPSLRPTFGGASKLNFTSPANIAFNSKRGTLLFTNRGDSAVSAVIEVSVNDRGAPLFYTDK